MNEIPNYERYMKVEVDGTLTTPMPLPTEAENELLDCLIEECAEVIQRATKLKRFGRDQVQIGQELTNAERLCEEFSDINVVAQFCLDKELFGTNPLKRIEDRALIKQEKLRRYLQKS